MVQTIRDAGEAAGLKPLAKLIQWYDRAFSLA